MADWQYLVKDLVTRTLVHSDLPLLNPSIDIELSGPGGVYGSITPDVWQGLRGPDGRPILRSWKTALFATDGANVYGGIVQRVVPDDNDPGLLAVDAPGFTSYPKGIPFRSHFLRWAADPYDALRTIWDHVQSYPDGDLGLVIPSGGSGIKLGPPAPPGRPADFTDKAPKKPTKGARPKRLRAEKENDYEARLQGWETMYDEQYAIWERASHEYESVKAQRKADQEKWDEIYGDWKPYELGWWEAPDCGDEIDRLASDAPFDYREVHRWNSTRTDFTHYLELGAPQLGSRRADLRFVQGENVAVMPRFGEDGDEFANEVLALGKGEGRAMLAGAAAVRDGRLRRPRVVTDKLRESRAALDTLARNELAQSRLQSVDELVVKNHPNAPLGSFRVGDEIPVDVTTASWLPPGRYWVRVLNINLRPAQDELLHLDVTTIGGAL